jgi:hypothetical protein
MTPHLFVRRGANQHAFEEEYLVTKFVGGESANTQSRWFQVTDAMKTLPGGGLAEEGELIQVFKKSVPESREFVARKNMTMSQATVSTQQV